MKDAVITERNAGEKNYFYFITLLRALAAIIITNAHYTGIYPSDIIANGGLLGDVLFFSVSGFCLSSPKMSFGKWYLKRAWRIYVVVWLITIVYWAVGAYKIHTFSDFVTSFIHPTKYHFIASIMLLYIPLYFIARSVELNRKNYVILSIALFALQIVLYFTVYDRSYYHIDTVREPMIEFLFFQSMILGLHFRYMCSSHNVKKGRGETTKAALGVVMVFCLVLYFASKLLFVKRSALAEYQIANQIILYICLFLVFAFAHSFEGDLQHLDGTVLWKVVKYLSDHTLEIYCVQSVIIGLVRGWGLAFPLNWFILTAFILLAATLLRLVSQRFIQLVKL